MSAYADYWRENIPPVSLIFILKSPFLVKVDLNKVVLQDSVKIFFKISLLTEILAKNVKKRKSFAKIDFFWDFDRFLSIFRQ